VGTDEDGEVSTRLFRMPMDLLGRRSKVFQAMLDGRFVESSTGLIKLPETSVMTFQDFYVWAMSYTPQVGADESFETVADLAIFATMYDVVALQNQTVEVIRSKLRVGDWQLQPGLVERIYEMVGGESNLRWLISVALGSINEPGNDFFGGRSSGITTEAIKVWREVFSKIADVGADFFEASQWGWGRGELEHGGPCRFHDHRGQAIPSDGTGLATECPFTRVECFGLELEATLGKVGSGKKRKDKKASKKAKAEEDLYASDLGGVGGQSPVSG
jgi:hypothetical protein